MKANAPLSPRSSRMEIHRRSKTPSNDGFDTKSISSKRNGAGTSLRPKHNSRPGNPYTASQTTTTDIVLFRSIQSLLVIAVFWFFSILLSADSPIATEDGLRGSKSAFITTVDPEDISNARDEITKVREEFYTRYGGKSEATGMLNRGLVTFENEKNTAAANSFSLRCTADRFLRSILRSEELQSISASSLQQAEFIMAFGGYSVTVGRGNHFEQSYPFIMQKILAPILELPPLGVKLIVRNSAIGGIPSFPYGWCLRNFLGEDADVVSWDYGMNEGKGAEGLESYVRQALMMSKTPPMFVLLDMKQPRLDLLQKYVNMGFLTDPVALGGRNAVSKKLLQLPENDKPPGLQRWDEWGAPKGSPGQSPWHPKKMEHELMGWLMAMHMLDAVEVALNVMEQDPHWREHIRQNPSSEGKLPVPVTDAGKTGAATILHGSPSKSDSTKWRMNRVSCRTSFLPNLFGNFDSIIQSGVTKDEDDIIKSRDDALFVGGWVMDVGKVERETKLKVQKYGGLGYIDMKTALYGIPSSGPLKLWLPYELSEKDSMLSTGDLQARKYFNSIVLCEVNEKRGDKECNMVSDLSFEVGGVAVAKTGITKIKEVASYLKKEICIRLDIPKDAEVSPKDNNYGLPVDITVTRSDVSRDNGACSISHVIWEHDG